MNILVYSMDHQPQPVATIVNYVCTIRITQQFGQLVIPLIVIFPRAAHEPAHSSGCGQLP